MSNIQQAFNQMLTLGAVAARTSPTLQTKAQVRDLKGQKAANAENFETIAYQAFDKEGNINPAYKSEINRSIDQNTAITQKLADLTGDPAYIKELAQSDDTKEIYEELFAEAEAKAKESLAKNTETKANQMEALEERKEIIKSGANLKKYRGPRSKQLQGGKN